MNFAFQNCDEGAGLFNPHFMKPSIKGDTGFTEQVAKRMAELGISKSALANRMNVSPAYITKMLRGNTNFTIHSMVKIVNSLDADVELRICPKATPRKAPLSKIGLVGPSGSGNPRPRE